MKEEMAKVLSIWNSSTRFCRLFVFRRPACVGVFPVPGLLANLGGEQNKETFISARVGGKVEQNETHFGHGPKKQKFAVS